MSRKCRAFERSSITNKKVWDISNLNVIKEQIHLNEFGYTKKFDIQVLLKHNESKKVNVMFLVRLKGNFSFAASTIPVAFPFPTYHRRILWQLRFHLEQLQFRGEFFLFLRINTPLFSYLLQKSTFNKHNFSFY